MLWLDSQRETQTKKDASIFFFKLFMKYISNKCSYFTLHCLKKHIYGVVVQVTVRPDNVINNLKQDKDQRSKAQALYCLGLELSWAKDE